MKRASALLLAAVISATLVLYPGQRAFAHTFSGDESAAFLSTVEIISIQTSLAQNNLGDSELATEHAEHAAEALTDSDVEELAERNERLATDLPAALEELQSAVESGQSEEQVTQIAGNIEALLGEAVDVRIEGSQLSNSTVRALVVANLLDEVMEHYASAYGIEEEEHDEEMSDTMSNETESSGASTTIVNEADYQSAQAIAIRTQELYGEIKSMAEPGTTEAISELDAAFADLVSAIDEQAPNTEVDEIVHSRVHPNLQTAYNLQVIPEFPLPLLLLLPLLAAVVVMGRLRPKPNGRQS